MGLIKMKIFVRVGAYLREGGYFRTFTSREEAFSMGS